MRDIDKGKVHGMLSAVVMLDTIRNLRSFRTSNIELSSLKARSLSSYNQLRGRENVIENDQ